MFENGNSKEIREKFEKSSREVREKRPGGGCFGWIVGQSQWIFHVLLSEDSQKWPQKATSRTVGQNVLRARVSTWKSDFNRIQLKFDQHTKENVLNRFAEIWRHISRHCRRSTWKQCEIRQMVNVGRLHWTERRERIAGKVGEFRLTSEKLILSRPTRPEMGLACGSIVKFITTAGQDQTTLSRPRVRVKKGEQKTHFDKLAKPRKSGWTRPIGYLSGGGLMTFVVAMSVKLWTNCCQSKELSIVTAQAVCLGVCARSVMNLHTPTVISHW